MNRINTKREEPVGPTGRGRNANRPENRYNHFDADSSAKFNPMATVEQDGDKASNNYYVEKKP